jgi:poly(beta-D-mannuronate) lyase
MRAGIFIVSCLPKFVGAFHEDFLVFQKGTLLIQRISETPHEIEYMNGARNLCWRSLGIYLSLTVGISWAAEPLRAPFDLSRHRDLFATKVESWSCPSPPPAVHDLNFSGFYADVGRGSSVVDPAAKQVYDRGTRAISQYENKLTEMSDLSLRADPPRAGIVACVLEWLHAWARGEAMLGRATEQGGYVRKWALAPISASYLKIRVEPSLDPAKRNVVERWIAGWASVVKKDYSTGTQRASRRNNHLYWAAWSIVLAGVVLNDLDLYEWAQDRYRFAVSQIRQDGTLPLELERKSRALHYHVFSVAPLVLIAETLSRNGGDPFPLNDGALHRLVKRTVSSLDDPAYFEHLSHVKQDLTVDLNGFDLAWMEPYYARFHDTTLEKWIQRFRPMKNRWLGGDMTFLFGVPEAPPR